MLQLNSLGHNQFEFARWCEKDREHYKIIKVGIVTENERRFSSVIQNLVTTADSTVLSTSFNYDYQPRQHIFYRNKWWEVMSVGEKSLEINPQALAYVNPQVNMIRYLEIKEVNLV